MLIRAGLVRSVRGARGGYRLADDPQKMTLEKIISVLEGDTDLVETPEQPAAPPMPLQQFLDRAVWMPLNKLTAAYFAGLTLADIAKAPQD